MQSGVLACRGTNTRLLNEERRTVTGRAICPDVGQQRLLAVTREVIDENRGSETALDGGVKGWPGDGAACDGLNEALAASEKRNWPEEFAEVNGGAKEVVGYQSRWWRGDGSRYSDSVSYVLRGMGWLFHAMG